jgi:demethylmenaquinone methyltransferase/2-methoxy-6-polyprenyl-1,4-benzoquinol methylase
MGSKYYQPGEQRAARVNDLFASIAPRYDLINDLQSFGLHRWWKRRLVALAAPQPGEKALDVCCGTGDLAFLLARRGAEVTAVDFSEAMLVVARERFKVQGSKFKVQGLLEFRDGDALALPFDDGSFDIVTVGYGLRNLSSWEAGLSEMWRVTKPGGRLLVLDFGKPDNALWRRAYFAYLRWLVPVFGKLFCGDSPAYRYIHESLLNYPAQRGVDAWLRRMNCAETRVFNLLGGAMSINCGRKK